MIVQLENAEAAAPRKPTNMEPRIMAQAVEWFLAMQKDSASSSNWSEFRSWYEARPEHREMYLWVEYTWNEGALAARVRGR